jgi:hypothetical protein
MQFYLARRPHYRAARRRRTAAQRRPHSAHYRGRLPRKNQLRAAWNGANRNHQRGKSGEAE